MHPKNKSFSVNCTFPIVLSRADLFAWSHTPSWSFQYQPGRSGRRGCRWWCWACRARCPCLEAGSGWGAAHSWSFPGRCRSSSSAAPPPAASGASGTPQTLLSCRAPHLAGSCRWWMSPSRWSTQTWSPPCSSGSWPPDGSSQQPSGFCNNKFATVLANKT